MNIFYTFTTSKILGFYVNIILLMIFKISNFSIAVILSKQMKPLPTKINSKLSSALILEWLKARSAAKRMSEILS